MSMILRRDRRAADLGLPLWIATAAAIALLCVPARVAAAGPLTVHASAGLGGVAKPGRWTPISIEIDNAGGQIATDIVVSWGDATLRRQVAFASSAKRRFTVYMRTLEPAGAVRVRLADAGDASADAAVQVLPHDAVVTLCIAGLASVIDAAERCSITLAPDQLPVSARAFEVVDQVLVADDVRLGAGARSTLAQWRSLRALENAGDLGLTPQVTRPMLTRGLPARSTQPIGALAALYVATLLVLGVAGTHRVLSPSSVWLVLAVLITAGGTAAMTIGRVGSSARLTIHHSSLMQQVPGTGASLVTLRGVAEFPAARHFALRVPVDDAMLEASAASGRAAQYQDAGGFPLLDGGFGLGARQAFLVEATVDAQWLAVEGDDRVVRISNRSTVPMRDCAFAPGMSTTEIGDLPPGATVTAQRIGDLAGPLFGCVADLSPISLTESAHDLDLTGTTRIVVYRDRAGLERADD